ncbi:MAG TPA: acyl-CoA dehydrogenase family protein [Pseudonocardia sp.]|jgi:alkylation response protein AidB-like acyl-CoA dehydrogenase|nr:acyl-CoA dehydrogenase family protein [Pseudonocardia sp.]
MADGLTGLTEEQRELSRTAARVLADAARKDPLPPDWHALPLGLNRPLWAALGELGLLGLTVPDSLGGSGAGVLDQCVLAEQVGAAVPAVPFTGTAAAAAVLSRSAASGAGSGAVGSGAVESGAAGVVAEVLAGLAEGTVVVAPAWESWPASVVPGRRSDALTLTGSAVGGTLRAVPFGMDADRLLAFDAEGTPLLVDLGGPGVRRAPVDSLDVQEPLATVTLDGAPATVLAPVELPVAEILTVLAAELVGAGQRALDGAVGYAKERRQFRRAIGSFQSIKHMLADRYVQLDAARLLVHAAAKHLDADLDADLDAADSTSDPVAVELAARTALASASDAADAATADALQTHGGIGFTWEHPSHVLLKRARARRILLGSQARQLEAIAAHILAG